MIDIEILKRAAAFGEKRRIQLGGAAIQQIVAELEAGRRAQAKLAKRDRAHG